MFGRIMPAPFAIPVNVAVLPADVDSARHGFRNRVSRHDGFGSSQPVMRVEPTDCLWQCGDQSLDRQGLHDHPGGKRKYLLGIAIDQLCQRLATCACSLKPGVSGARVCIASVDDQGAHTLSSGQMFTTQQDRCRGKPVFCKHTCNARAIGDAKDQQIFATDLAYPRFRPAKFDAANWMQQRRIGCLKVNSHAANSRWNAAYEATLPLAFVLRAYARPLRRERA